MEQAGGLKGPGPAFRNTSSRVLLIQPLLAKLSFDINPISPSQHHLLVIVNPIQAGVFCYYIGWGTHCAIPPWILLSRRPEEHTNSRHFLINMNVPKFPKIALEPPEYPKIGKHLIYEHL